MDNITIENVPRLVLAAKGERARCAEVARPVNAPKRWNRPHSSKGHECTWAMALAQTTSSLSVPTWIHRARTMGMATWRVLKCLCSIHGKLLSNVHKTIESNKPAKMQGSVASTTRGNLSVGLGRVLESWQSTPGWAARFSECPGREREGLCRDRTAIDRLAYCRVAARGFRVRKGPTHVITPEHLPNAITNHLTRSSGLANT